ncbi:uncharacterized protein EI90DRAFT_106347 [Cantharellus anzutake]|uniref:uncharacterized protein n=1 Tax=Cantharellus anzutake TaxID=1750568 RepID=UPI0019082E1D|nr:uncharacterized protein EI90DRAFT_106347 [Cantharellus anzutake]KAF8337052.1 hypothetical protein EI90DRAFT_106347 [Cantharellus anzutake]
MEESNSSSSRSDKAAKAKPRPRTKTSRPSYASKSREVLVPVCISRAQAMLQFICDSFPPRAAIEFLPERILGQTTAAALLMIEILYHPTLSSYICEDTAIYTSTLNNWANVMQMASAQYPFDQARTCSSAVYSRLVREQANVRSILYSSALPLGTW